MNTRYALALASLLLAPLAQAESPAPAPMVKAPGMTQAEEKSGMQVDLKLTEEQKQKIQAIHEEARKKHEALREETYQKELKVLTPEQAKKLEAHRAEKMAREAKKMERDAEHMERRAELMEKRAERMQKRADQMKEQAKEPVKTY